MKIEASKPAQVAPPSAPVNYAKRVKIISTLFIIGGLVAWIVCAATEAPAMQYNWGTLAFFGGFAGFVVGRFME